MIRIMIAGRRLSPVPPSSERVADFGALTSHYSHRKGRPRCSYSTRSCDHTCPPFCLFWSKGAARSFGGEFLGGFFQVPAPIFWITRKGDQIVCQTPNLVPESSQSSISFIKRLWTVNANSPIKN